MGSRHEPNILELERAWGHPRARVADAHRLWPACPSPQSRRRRPDRAVCPSIPLGRWGGQRDVRVFASQIRTGCGDTPGPTPMRGQNGLNLTPPAVSRARWSGQRDIRVFASQIRTGCGRSPRIHGDDGEDFVELAVPRSPALDEAGNGTSAYLLRKSAPAAVAYRRPCLLAINASRLFNARTLSGSSPGTLLKKAQ